jgi:predicted patatin/cPLA2 family phospholipase
VKKILVLKGGGVRGVLQLDSLRIIEKHYQKQIFEIFDLIVGTSVGAITGGVLSLGTFPAREYAELFIKYIPLIFKTFWWRGILGPKYIRQNYYTMWENLFGTKKIKMNECKTKYMIASVNLCDNRTHFFKSWEEKDGRLNLREAIAKSFAAPHYFGQINDKAHKAVWVDGGVGISNTPLDMAYAEMIRLGWDKEPVKFLLMGTGKVDLSIPYKKAKTLDDFQQVLKYMSPSEGGLARIQSTIDQVSRMRIIANANPLISFKYYDIDIGKEYDGIDKVKFMREYIAFGTMLSKEVSQDLKISEDF